MLAENVTEEQFRKLFPNHPHLWDNLTTNPKDKADLIRNYLPSKLWRMNNIYSIINKHGDTVPFVMNRAQLVVYSYVLQHPRLIILKSRQQGISTFWLLSYFDDTIFRANFNSGLMAQGKDEAGTLLERIKFAWDHLDDDLKALMGIKIQKNNSSEFTMSNGSTLFIRTSFRSATLQRLHISELGKIANKYPERAKETKTGTLQALAPGNIGVIESTAEGDNMFKTMWDAAVVQYAGRNIATKDFLPVFLSWIDDPDCVEDQEQYPDEEEALYFERLEKELDVKLTQRQRNFWIMQHRELEGYIHQEYPATPNEAFTAAKDGTYWAKRFVENVVRRGQIKKRAELYDKNLDTYIVIDSGRSDYFVMLFFQVWRGTVRIVHEYYANGEWIGFYVDMAKEIADEYGYNVVHWYLPHDLGVVDITQHENKSREEVINDLGVTNTTILEKNNLREGIENVRQFFPNIWLAEECTYIEQCCLNYTKEWDPLREIWKEEPKKGKWCHGADTVRYMVQTVEFHLTEHFAEDGEFGSVRDSLGV